MHVSRLRKGLAEAGGDGGRLVSHAGGYRLELQPASAMSTAGSRRSAGHGGRVPTVSRGSPGRGSRRRSASGAASRSAA